MFQPPGSLPDAWLAALTLLRPLLPVLEDKDTPGGVNALCTLDVKWVEPWRALRLAPLMYRQLARRGWKARMAPPWWSTLRDDYVLALQAAWPEE